MAANNHCIIQAFITIVVSGIHLCSNRWCNGDIGNNFLLNLFFQNICRALDQTSNINNPKRNINGMKIHILMFKRYNNDAKNHPNAKAQESHINIFAGLILKNINAIKTAISIDNTVVAI